MSAVMAMATAVTTALAAAVAISGECQIVERECRERRSTEADDERSQRDAAKAPRLASWGMNRLAHCSNSCFVAEGADRVRADASLFETK
jgi:hypothetical protein